jgi:hypothetical protein
MDNGRQADSEVPETMSQQPKRRRPKPRPRTQPVAASAPPATTQPILEGTVPPTASAVPVPPTTDEPAPAPSITPSGDPHGYLAIGLAAGAVAVVAFLTILAAMAAT